MNALQPSRSPELDSLLRECDSQSRPPDHEAGNGVADHCLGELPVFDDPGLIELIEDEHVERTIATMGDHPAYPTEYQVGELGIDQGGELLTRIQDGRLELTIRDRGCGTLGILVERVCRDWIVSRVPAGRGGRRVGQRGEVTISSPGALTYYDVAFDHTVLWQVRGFRSVWVYPPEDRFRGARMMERIARGERVDTIPFDPAFDAAAQIFELKPGEFLSVPPECPFRCVTGSHRSVALITTIATVETCRRFRRHLFRGLLRRHTSLPVDRPLGKALAFWLAAGSTPFASPKGPARPRQRVLESSFRIDREDITDRSTTVETHPVTPTRFVMTALPAAALEN